MLQTSLVVARLVCTVKFGHCKLGGVCTVKFGGGSDLYGCVANGSGRL